jgi:small subunit ribosomal protein S13
VARIAGVDLPRNKHVGIALTYIYGIGRTTAQRILKEASVDPHKIVDKLTDEEVAKVRSVLEAGYKLEGSLRTEVSMNIKRLMEIGAYRGFRHRRGLPVRGQRTSTNSRTRKGPRRTVGQKRKK